MMAGSLALALVVWLLPHAVATEAAAAAASRPACIACFVSSLLEDPVCGKDGFNYSHRCLATCQDVDIVRTGRCEGECHREGNVNVSTGYAPCIITPAPEQAVSTKACPPHPGAPKWLAYLSF